MKFWILVYLSFCSSASIVDERVDISCVDDTCRKMRYRLFTSGSSYQMTIEQVSPCRLSLCANCFSKGDWDLSFFNGDYYLQRSTISCVDDDSKRLGDMFPISNNAPSNSYTVSDIACSSGFCSKYQYTLLYDTYPTMTSSAPVYCDRFYCSSCTTKDKWTLSSYNGRYIMQRKMSICQIISKIKMIDYFIVPNTTELPSMFKGPSTVNNINGQNDPSVWFWDASRIVAVIISCLSFISLITILSVCFCGSGNTPLAVNNYG